MCAALVRGAIGASTTRTALVRGAGIMVSTAAVMLCLPELGVLGGPVWRRVHWPVVDHSKVISRLVRTSTQLMTFDRKA
jgi:hypothetical protein